MKKTILLLTDGDLFSHAKNRIFKVLSDFNIDVYIAHTADLIMYVSSDNKIQIIK